MTHQSINCFALITATFLPRPPLPREVRAAPASSGTWSPCSSGLVRDVGWRSRVLYCYWHWFSTVRFPCSSEMMKTLLSLTKNLNLMMILKKKVFRYGTDLFVYIGNIAIHSSIGHQYRVVFQLRISFPSSFFAVLQSNSNNNDIWRDYFEQGPWMNGCLVIHCSRNIIFKKQAFRQ